ncbi:methyltransferase family protein [Anseongella ginsenosidimutans]|uniref:Methyltransferase family protein n=2 Tax=Anseongella ginsenosidimutans TaxID=496056 RepID=A0A4R3KRV0_9SPHI|nr:class I SAM-dependent methyltransferase [Anseongella ginsenosidimutans]TCS87762.1 methyltransferase family protein [Anseongella ginsenosidimutans]
MDRLYVIQTLMKQRKLKNYLEIGVFNGHVFFRIQSSFKVAVDPEPNFTVYRKIGKTVFNPSNFFNQYFQKTSDAFFIEDACSLYKNRQIEIALIDGMHEYSYALRDIENTLDHLSDDGIIIVHDCNPRNREHACSFKEYKDRNFTGIWNGDVWKAIVHLRAHRDDINVFVLDCDHGLGIIQKGKPRHHKPKFNGPDIASFTFEDLDSNREEWLGLKPANYFYDHFSLYPSAQW